MLVSRGRLGGGKALRLVVGGRRVNGRMAVRVAVMPVVVVTVIVAVLVVVVVIVIVIVMGSRPSSVNGPPATGGNTGLPERAAAL
jgi:hypothetical protein